MLECHDKRIPKLKHREKCAILSTLLNVMVQSYLAVPKLCKDSNSMICCWMYLIKNILNVYAIHWVLEYKFNALPVERSNTVECLLRYHGVSYNQPNDCLLNCLFRRRWNKTLKLRITGLCARNSPVNGDFPTQRASNAENVSILWRHHGPYISRTLIMPY